MVLLVKMGGAAAERAAGFLGACLPAGAFPSAPQMRGAGGALLYRHPIIAHTDSRDHVMSIENLGSRRRLPQRGIELFIV